MAVAGHMCIGEMGRDGNGWAHTVLTQAEMVAKEACTQAAWCHAGCGPHMQTPPSCDGDSILGG
eukprot:scaffold94522_cov19-Tisochrysis_lutea.AAC.1